MKFRNDSWLNSLRGTFAAWGVVRAFLFLSVAPAFVQAQTPAGTSITNLATASYLFGDVTRSVTSDVVELTVGTPPGNRAVTLEPDRSITAAGGTTLTFAHMLRNEGNLSDSFNITASSPGGWTVRLYKDLNANGVLDEGEPEITGPIALEPNASVGILAITTVPTTFKEGDNAEITITAISVTDSTVTDSATDTIKGVKAEEPLTATLKLEKQVDKTEAAPGELLTYSIAFEANGTGPVLDAVVTDSIPAGVIYENATLRLDGQALTDQADPDRGSFESGGSPRVVVQLGTLQPGSRGTLEFRARIVAGAAAGTSITNKVWARFGRDGESSAGPATAVTKIIAGPVAPFDYKLTKRVVGPNDRKVGETVRYRLVATNLTTTPISGLQVLDTLPAVLDFVAATPAAASVNGRVLSWITSLGALDSAVILVDAKVNSTVSQRVQALNFARAILDTMVRTDTASIFVEPGVAPRLEITLTARVLEVAIGQTATLVATVRNPGPETLGDLVVELTLPEGTRYVDGSLNGAELIRVEGNKLIVRLQGSLASGESRTFTYAISIVNPPSSELVNRAVATARGGSVVSVVSNEAVVVLRLLAGMSAQTSVVIGKAWADLDGNGRQDDGEEGLANIDVWTEDGAVARTDVDGKFSFVNLRLGSHVFRADPTTIPAGYMLHPKKDNMMRVRLTGWTSPRIGLPILPAPGIEARMLRDAGGYKPTTTAVHAEAAAVLPDEAEDGVTRPRLGAQLASSVSSITAAAPPIRTSPIDETLKVSVAPAMTEEQRKAETSRDFLAGPGVQIVTPADGSVLPSDRIFLIARAERGMPSTLKQGDSVINTGAVRIDGVQEFSGIRLASGPNLLTLEVRNSWKNLRLDKVRVHVSGPITSVIPETTRIVVPADGVTSAQLRVRLLDEWMVPVVNHPYVDVSLEGGTFITPDATASSLGHQVQADGTGWVTIDFKGGLKVGRGKLKLTTGRASAEVEIEVVARARPLMMIGTGQFGVGASGQNYGALSVRGRVTGNTAVTISYDTRRLDDGRGVFRRTTDPLADGIYPMLGDASAMRTLSAARGQLSATIERGLDHVSFGDVQTGAIAEDFTLARYARSITGASTRISTGPLVWSAFGAASSQSLKQVQLRGRGVSGPYDIGASIIPGTQQVQIEVRDASDAQRVLSRTALVPYIDYEINPGRGEIMLKRPMPAADANGNSVFMVITAETAGAGERKSLWGVRVAGSLDDLARSSRLKGVTIGASVVHDGQVLRPLNLLGADIRFAPTRNVDLAAEIAHSGVGDSSGTASSLRGTVRLLDDALTLAGRFSSVGNGFSNPSNSALLGGTTDLQASAAMRIGKGEARLEHSRQDFAPLSIGRRRTQLSLRQSLTARAELELRMADDDINGGADPRQLGSGEAKLTWSLSDRLKLWTEARNSLYSRGSSENVPAGSMGGGLSFQALENVAVEMRHMAMAASRGKEAYSVTNFGVRSQLAGGAQAWGSYELTGGVEGARNAAIIGLNNRLRLTEALSVSGMFERRMGVERSTADDPVRALPFVQAEQDYWSGGLGLEYLPQEKPYRFSMKGERKDGQEKSLMLQAAGDITLGTSFGILSRQELSSRENGVVSLGGGIAKTDHRASLWGLAWRPKSTDRFNTLMELRWVKDERPNSAGPVDRRAKDEKLAAALEVIWLPTSRVELASRYAIRRSNSLLVEPGLPEIEQRTDVSFIGGRGDFNVARWLAVRGEARGMTERRSGAKTWDVAPSLVLHPIQAVEVAVGKRWGTLQDADFAVNGGKGWFLTVGARVTEATFPTAAAFWRNRFQR